MPLSTTEILRRAYDFVARWHDGAKSEKSDAQTFVVDWLEIFGVDPRKTKTLEFPLRRESGARGYADFFWPRQILIEMKTSGSDLDAAFRQAIDYCHSPTLQDKLPRGVLVCNFDEFRYYDFDESRETRFALKDLPGYVQNFYYLSGYVKKIYPEQDPANLKATELMGRLHDRLRTLKYDPKDLELYLARLLFCLFADDSGVFDKDEMLNYVRTETRPDGADLGAKLNELFETLDTPEENRSQALDAKLARFPYVDGGLFRGALRVAHFDAPARDALIQCCEFDWSGISPVLFGALFQCAMDQKERRNLGAHYTSERNILKALEPLFLDELRAELAQIKKLAGGVKRRERLRNFHEKLKSIKIFDPACGCGNFLVVAYRELRLLENDVLKELYGDEIKRRGRYLSVEFQAQVDVDQFYGIELEELPAQIARVAMWLTDHQMNQKTSLVLGEYMTRIPLTAAPNILCANALATEWNDVAPRDEIGYVVGNPPYVGFTYANATQKAEMASIFPGVKNLDYVAAWFKKAAEYIQGTSISCAFVATNSICQGEAVAPLWSVLFEKYGVKINFAHQSFKWSNEAAKNAGVCCVIVGFALFDAPIKRLFVYDRAGESKETRATNINAYLVDGADVIVQGRKTALCDVPPISWGSKPTDAGNFIVLDSEKDEFLAKEPLASKYLRPYVGAEEFLNGKKRYVLWLVDCPPNELRKMPTVLKRVEAVREFRVKSAKAATRKKADTPTLFDENHQPNTDYLFVPKTSSGRRQYIPIGFMAKDVIASDAGFVVSEATLYSFGVLTSAMHNAWNARFCGRLKTDFRYSKELVYNTFPWPEPTPEQRAKIETLAQAVLDARAAFPEATYADLYDPNTTPPKLLRAHRALDLAVERAYRKEKFNSEEERVAFLLERYLELVGQPRLSEARIR